MTASTRRLTVLASVAAAVLVVDAATKVAAVAWLAEAPVRLGPFLALRLVHNRGVVFGVAAGAPPPAVLGLTAAAALAIAILAIRGALGAAAPAGMIVGRALANVVDRATGGSVVDFLDIGRWPTFNLADVFLVTGIGMLLLTSDGPGTRADPIDVVPDTDQDRRATSAGGASAAAAAGVVS